MPVFVWMTLVASFLLLFAMPIITVALFLLMFDRNFGANFFNPAAGGDPVLWQHLFWLFGHPEVYILILPAMGIVSEILPVFSRKPLFGYRVVVFSGIAIGFMGWGVWVHHMFAVGLGPWAVSAFSVATMFIAVPTGVKIFNWLATCWRGSIKLTTPMLFALGFVGWGVWAHHMFASGLGPISVAAFSVSTMFIAVPTGVKILNWMATMWGGKLTFPTPMLFAVGLVAMFTIGGLSGVTHAVAPADTQQTDTYYIVAHFHYVIFGGALLAFIGGFYFWWPKAFGYFLDDRIGKVNFWLTIIGFNLTFGPMHILGLQGMSRRIHTYRDGYGFNFWNLMSTIGAFIIAVSMLILFWNIIRSSRRRHLQAAPGPDPWDARSLEWSIPSPVPEHNFDDAPVITQVDDWWHRKYGEDETGKVVRIAEAEDIAMVGDGSRAHLPSPSYFPLLLAAGLPVIGYGLIFNMWFCALGGAMVLSGFVGWALEPADDPDLPPHGDDGHDHDPADDGGDADGAATEGDETREEVSVGD
jgi:cytochrome c oxidase subunit 1